MKAIRYHYARVNTITARLLILLYSLVITHHSLVAQPGTWQTHFSYRSAQSVAVIGQNVYAATRNGFFQYNKSTSDIRLLGRDNGLSDVSISRVLALPDPSRLMLAYRSGSIDFLSVNAAGEPTDVRTINTITTSDRIPVRFRGINHINRAGTTAYLSTDFGLVVFDLSRNEIRDTYFSPVNNGVPVATLMTAILGDSLYALTTPPYNGPRTPKILAVRLSPATNIADPANWRPSADPGPFSAGRPTMLVADADRLLVAVNEQGRGLLLARKPGGPWTVVANGRESGTGVFAGPVGPGLFVVDNAGLPTLTVPGSGTFTGSLLRNPREVVPDGGLAWVADTTNGLLEAGPAGIRPVSPDGPFADSFVKLLAYPNQLVALPTYKQTSENLPPNQPQTERYDLTTGRWQNNLILTLKRSFTTAVYLPGEQRLYLGSFGDGLWSQTEGQAPSRLTAMGPVGPLITALATDAEGNLWISDQSGGNGASLHVRRPNGTFESFNKLGSLPIDQIVPDDYGTLWIRLTYGVLLAFNPKTGQQRYFSTAPGDGNLPGNDVTAIVRDRNGLLWVGTDRGVTVFDDPARVFQGSVSANAPIFDRRRLLATETITAMAVDGGNRKWIATESALYRFGTDGTTLESRFTPADSPLPTTSINALAIEPVSGRVFVSTSGGLVSFGGAATEPAEALTGITIFPNPVRPDFAGLVGIRGLTDNAVVKILDAAGQLVHETRAQGGTATWNLLDYRGRSAQTGLYLVVVIAANGQEGIVGKLAVIR